MAQQHKDIANYQTDTLFLLIGANPLPNFVAAKILAKPGATVYLLHTASSIDEARRLERKLKEEDKRPDVRIVLSEIHHADGQAIEQKVKQLVKDVPSSHSVGLNYTGGTKAMSTHVYHILRDKFHKGIFTYLDAQSLKMIVRRSDEPAQSILATTNIQLTFDDLLDMHGYTYQPYKPNLPAERKAIARAMAAVVATQAGYDALKGIDRRSRKKGWLRMQQRVQSLPERATYPALEPLIAVFEEIGGTADVVAQVLGYRSLSSATEWFQGKWLEDYTLLSLHPLVTSSLIDFCEVNLVPVLTEERKRELRFNLELERFELDVAAMVGYQLFALSCIANANKGGATKQHLLEALVRTRQLGGDEARFALVCLGDDTVKLQLKADIQETFQSGGKIEVFGRHDLLKLTDHIEQWMRKTVKE